MNPLVRILKGVARRAQSWWTDKQGWGALVPSGAGVRSGVSVTPETALGLTAAYAAINVIATDTAALPVRVYRRQPDGSRVEVPDHPASELLKWSPQGQTIETTSMRQRQAWMGHTLGWGNGYQEIERDNAGRPIALHLLCPKGTQPERRTEDRRLVYRLPNGKTIPPTHVLHLAGLGFDGLRGYSPVQLAREAIGLGLAAEAFGASFFGNGSMPRGVLKHPGRVGEEVLKDLRANWEEIHRGPDNANRMAILEEGMEWIQTTINPQDAQFLATREFQVKEIARLYRVPPHKIGDFSEAHLANFEAGNLDYLITVLAPWCEQQEQEYSLKLLTREERLAGYYIEHVLAALLRGDSKARAEFYTKLRDLGALSPNEVRRMENMNPVPHGDVHLVPLNMTTLQNAGAVALAKSAPEKK